MLIITPHTAGLATFEELENCLMLWLSHLTLGKMLLLSRLPPSPSSLALCARHHVKICGHQLSTSTSILYFYNKRWLHLDIPVTFLDIVCIFCISYSHVHLWSTPNLLRTPSNVAVNGVYHICFCMTIIKSHWCGECAYVYSLLHALKQHRWEIILLRIQLRDTYRKNRNIYI